MQAIILKKTAFSEGNEIITMYSRELGRVRGIARAVKFSKSKLAHALQTLFCSEVELIKTKKNFTITGVRVIDPFKNLREDPAKVNLALYAADVLLKSTADEHPNEELYDYFLSYLNHLNSSSKKEHCCFSFFALHALALSGYSLDYSKCVNCSRDLALEKQVFFNLRKSGFLCKNCSLKLADTYPLSNELWAALGSDMLDFELQDEHIGVVKELKKFSNLFAEHILERELKSSKFV